MNGRTIALASAALLLATLAPALADRGTPVKAGVPVADLTPPGMVRVRVAAPAGPTLPVRLVYREADDDRPAVLVDVWIGDTAADARATLMRWQAHWARQPRPVADLGDTGFSAPGLRAFCRHNIAISVRRVAGATDLEQLARSYLAAVDAAPDGAPRGRAVAPILPDRLPVGRSQPLAMSGQALALEVTGQGPVAIRPTRSGWRIRRTGAGRVTVAVTSVDPLLRVSRASQSKPAAD